jgi:hypothetical protein
MEVEKIPVMNDDEMVSVERERECVCMLKGGVVYLRFFVPFSLSACLPVCLCFSDITAPSTDIS